jgi:hypothetical protein
MIRTTLTAAAALLLAGTAHAQSFYPHTYAMRFCQLSRMGISPDQARSTAMREAWSNTREPVLVDYKGTPTSLDVLDASHLVVNDCPEFVK